MSEAQENTTATENTAAEAQARDAIHAAIKANFDNTIDTKEVQFNFRTVEEVDNEGKKTGIKTKRPSVKVVIPVPSVEGIIAMLQEGGKPLELLQEAVYDVVIGRAREIVNEREDITQENFPLADLLWKTIANMPRETRRGAGIPKEVWEAFGEDYCEVMPAVTGKSKEEQKQVADILVGKLQKVRSNKKALQIIEGRLDLYINTSPNAEQFTDCVKFLQNKIKDFLAAGDEALMAAL